MNLSRYGFIVLAPGYQADKHQAQLSSSEFQTMVVGVASLTEAEIVAKKMIDKGVQLIELCGGFGREQAQSLINSLNTSVPIGFVEFSEDEQAKLDVLLND